jgi:3-hydroxybutyryl-CoA dehydrogenase
MQEIQPIESICVCGAGTMGSGIAQLAAVAGYATIQLDTNPLMLEKSKALIRKNLDFLLAKSKISAADAEAVMNRIRFTTEVNDVIANLVIEAIIEEKSAKINLFDQLMKLNAGTTIFATNTSSISVTEIAEALPDPSRVAGMHFFNPAPLMKLVEIIHTKFTTPAITDSLLQVAQRMGKTAVLCKDAPGFIVNRVARPYYLESLRLVEEESVTPETIDAVLEATGFKMGPFRLMDLIGMDINYNVSRIVWEALGEPARLRPSSLQQQKLAAGELGRKTGKGFYRYSE